MTLETKLHIIKRYEKRKGASSVVSALNLVLNSIVFTVLKNAEKIKKTAEGPTTLMAKKLARRRKAISMI